MTSNSPVSGLTSNTESPLIQCQVLVIGSGPAGSTTALELARAGVDVLVLEKATFPRFQIGESFLPYNLELIQELKLEENLRKRPHITKRGAEFAMGNAKSTTLYHFDLSLAGKGTGSFNIARADFDCMIQEAAVDAGARIMQPATVKQILELSDGNVRVLLDDGTQVQAKYLVDATGQNSLLGRHLKLRSAASDPHLRKVAYFGHYAGVKRLKGYNEGMVTIIMCDEGWFWIIPLNETNTSVGFVVDSTTAKTITQSGVPANKMLAWGIEHCPLMTTRMAEAKGINTNDVRADFSYRCPPFAGEGFFLVGDAAMFLDPVFSTGVCLGMRQGCEVARHLASILQKNASPAAARTAYAKSVKQSTYWFSKLIKMYYDHRFRELFLHGRGPLEVHKALIAVLAGHVFPKPLWKVRWRFLFFELCLKVQGHFPLVPRRPMFSLLKSEDQPSQVASEQIAIASPSDAM